MEKKIFTKPSVMVVSFMEGVNVIATSGGPKNYNVNTGSSDVPTVDNKIWDR